MHFQNLCLRSVSGRASFLQDSWSVNCVLLQKGFDSTALSMRPTAMIKHADENPATYLNKEYTYYLSVADTSAMGLLV